MNWFVALISGVVGALIAGAMTRLLQKRASGWSGLRRVLTASAMLPGIILTFTVIGVASAQLTGPEHGESNRHVVSFVYKIIGAIFAGLTVVGGLVGAALAEWRDRA